jgi:hypothetical protein
VTDDELIRHYGAIQPEEPREDPWEELLNLARYDPYVARAVDMVRYRGMSVGDACIHLALYQTRRAMELQNMATNLLKSQPAPLYFKIDGKKN